MAGIARGRAGASSECRACARGSGRVVAFQRGLSAPLRLHFAAGDLVADPAPGVTRGDRLQRDVDRVRPGGLPGVSQGAALRRPVGVDPSRSAVGDLGGGMRPLVGLRAPRQARVVEPQRAHRHRAGNAGFCRVVRRPARGRDRGTRRRVRDAARVLAAPYWNARHARAALARHALRSRSPVSADDLVAERPRVAWPLSSSSC